MRHPELALPLVSSSGKQDVKLYNSILNSLPYKEALTYFADLKQKGVKFTSVTYNTMLMNSDNPEYWLQSMTEAKVPMTSVTASICLRHFVSRQNFSKAAVIMRQMQRNGLKPSPVEVNKAKVAVQRSRNKQGNTDGSKDLGAWLEKNLSD